MELSITFCFIHPDFVKQSLALYLMMKTIIQCSSLLQMMRTVFCCISVCVLVDQVSSEGTYFLNPFLEGEYILSLDICGG